MKNLALAATLAIALPSCSLLFDAADISSRRSKAIAEGEAVAGDGFAVRAPEAGLYSSAQDTRPGGVTLRPTEPLLDGLVYIATPFDGGGASTPREAFDRWNDIPKARGFSVSAFDGRSTTFQGLPAYRASVEISKGSSSQVASILVARRSSDFLVLSTGHPFFHPDARGNRKKFTDERLRKLQSATTITKR